MAIHLVDIKEVFSNADGTVQFIELSPGANNNEGFWEGQSITVSRTGSATNTLVFDHGFTGTSNKSMLLATTGFQTLTGITPDFIIPSNFLYVSGSVTINFASSTDIVTYNNNLPTDGVNSLVRSGTTMALTVTAAATPRNFDGQTVTFPIGNAAPVVANPIPDTIAGADDPFSLLVAANTFTDANNDELTYSADSLPAGLTFDPETRTFGGAPEDPGTYSIEVTANDGEDSVTDTFILTVISGDIESGDGNANTITGTPDNDLLSGLGGADTIDGAGGSDTISGGAGIDLLLSSASVALGSDLENLTLTGTDDIDGTGNSLGNVIIGNEGDNQLNGLGGADTLIGGDGNDVYVIETLFTIASSSEVLVIEEEEGGEDLVESELGFSLPANVEALTLTGGLSVNATGNDEDNTLTGNSGNNVLDGEAGADTMSGNAGNDTYMVDSSDDEVIETTGIDTVISSASYSLPAGVERLTLTLSGGGEGLGNGLGNTILGGAGNDSLFGDAGNDSLNGNAGADSLDGGEGNDSLKGGEGSDDFFFASMSGSDKVLDFLSGVDAVHIDNAVFDGLGEGTPELATGTAGEITATSAGILKFRTDTGQLYYDADGEGTGALYLIATFDACGAGAPGLAASDIVVFTGVV